MQNKMMIYLYFFGIMVCFIQQANGQITKGVTLKDCVLKAQENNVTLQKNWKALQSVHTAIDSAKGKFDPAFYANLVGSENKSPSTSAYDQALGITNYDRDNFNISSGFTGSMLSGATYTLGVNLNRNYDPASGAYLAHNPLFYNNVGIDLKQPLLKGAWTTYARSELIKATLNTESEVLNWTASLNDTVFNAIEAYWNLVFAIEDLEAKKYSLTLAEDLLAINTRKKEEGVFSKMEVLEAKADVAMKKEQLLTAENGVKSAEDNLKKIIFAFEDEKEWNVKLAPLTKAREAEDIEYDMDDLLLMAMENRPDYKRLMVDLKSKGLDINTARNELMPQLDFTGAWKYNAIAGNYSNAFDDVWKRKYHNFSVGVEFSYPIGNRSANAAVRQANYELTRAQIAVREMRVQISHELRDAIRQVGLQREKIQATRESWRLAKERYEGEKKRLEAGITIPYQVREAERNYHNETVSKTRALLDYQIARARILKVTGALLREYGVSVDVEGMLD